MHSDDKEIDSSLNSKDYDLPEIPKEEVIDNEILENNKNKENASEQRYSSVIDSYLELNKNGMKKDYYPSMLLAHSFFTLIGNKKRREYKTKINVNNNPIIQKETQNSLVNNIKQDSENISFNNSSKERTEDMETIYSFALSEHPFNFFINFCQKEKWHPPIVNQILLPGDIPNYKTQISLLNPQIPNSKYFAEEFGPQKKISKSKININYREMCRKAS